MNWNLIHKYLADECSRQERLRFEEWLNEDPQNRAFFQSVKRVWDVSPQQALDAMQLESLIKDDDAAWEQFKANHPEFPRTDYSTDKSNITDSNKYRHLWQRRKKLQKRALYAAAVIALLIAALFVFRSTPKQSSVQNISHTYISDADEHINLKLSDGTHITLNENSKLVIKGNFSPKHRRVFLKGEAFFKVAHHGDHPFIINVNGAVVKDLSTQFNVKTNTKAHNVQVAVIEGRVALNSTGGGNSTGIILGQNELGVYNVTTGTFSKEHTRAKNFVSWFTGRLIFKNNSLLDVSRQLGYLYDVKIDFANNKLKSRRLSASLDKEDLKSVLNVIAKTLSIDYTMNNNVITWK